MPRRVYDSIAPHQECPKCRYPMLRAESLGSLIDQLPAFYPQESWIPALAYKVPLWLLAGGAVYGLVSAVIWVYSSLAHTPSLLWLARV